MSTAEIIPYPTAGGASALKQENGSSSAANFFVEEICTQAVKVRLGLDFMKLNMQSNSKFG